MRLVSANVGTFLFTLRSPTVRSLMRDSVPNPRFTTSVFERTSDVVD